MTLHERLSEFLHGKPDRAWKNNTRIRLESDGSYRVRLHGTDIVTVSPSGKITLDSGGWRTVTTKTRINQFSREFASDAWGVYQTGFQWYLSRSNPPRTVEFSDGMVLQ